MRYLNPANFSVLWNYFICRKRQPFLASFKLTYRCNLTCAQCPFHQMASSEATFSDVTATLERLRARGNRIVIFEGGEPMLWRDGHYTIHDVVEQAKKRFLCTGMTSNGTLPLDVPTDTLWVSVDGFEKTHNRLRQADIFKQVIDNIRNSPHPKLFAHITVNSINYSEVPQLINYLAPMVRGITIQFYYPYHRNYELFLDMEQRALLLDKIIWLKKSGLPIKNSIASLEALKRNNWTCLDWLIDNADPDGNIRQGCYVKGRDDIDCARCGFSPHTEISLAFNGNPGAIRAGLDIFLP